MRGHTAKWLLRASAAFAALLAFGQPTVFAATFLFGDTPPVPVTLANGESLDNAAIIDGRPLPFPPDPTVHNGAGAFDIPMILNRETGKIYGTYETIVVNGRLEVFDNRGLVSGGESGSGSGAVVVGGRIETFRNSGEIVSNDSFAVRVVYNGAVPNPGSSGSIGDFLNTNYIHGVGGVYVENTIDTFLNRGDILADIQDGSGFTGTGVYVGEVVDRFVNSGRIETDSTGYAAVELGNGVNGFVNSGTLWGGQVGFTTIGSTGSFMNSGDIFGDDVAVGLRDAVNFSNSGRIGLDWMNPGPAPYYSYYGVTLFDAETFTNSGKIYGYGTGVSAHNIGSIVNSGQIVSATDIAFEISGTVGTIVNTGSLSADVAGLAVLDHVSSFVNSGTVVAEGQGGLGVGAVFAGGLDRFVNTGRIFGYDMGVIIGDDSIFGGAGSTAGTSIFNSGTIETDPCGCGIIGLGFSGGSLINSGTIRSGIGVAILPTAAAATEITNSGTIQGTETIFTWPFAPFPDITMAILFDSIDPYDPVANNAGLARDDFLRLLPGSKILGAVDFAKGTDTLDLTRYQGSSVQLFYNLENVLAGKGVLLDGASGCGCSPLPLLATIDDTSIKTVGPAQFGNFTSMLLSGISGGLNGGAGGTSGPGTLNYFPARAESPAVSAADGLAAPGATGQPVWGAAFGGMSTDATVGSSYAQVLGGLIAGTHVAVGGNTTLGGIVSLGAGQYATPAQGHVITSTLGALGLYGETDLDVATIDFALLGGASINHSAREVSGIFGVQSAVADYMSWFVSPSVALSVPVALFDPVDTEAGLSLKYVGGSVGAYDETGSVLNMSVPARAVGLFEARAEFRASSTIGSNDYGDAVLTATVGALGQANLGAADVTFGIASAFGAGGSLTSAAPGVFAYGAYAGAQVDAPIGENVALTFKAGGEIRSDSVASVSGSAKLAGNF